MTGDDRHDDRSGAADGRPREPGDDPAQSRLATLLPADEALPSGLDRQRLVSLGHVLGIVLLLAVVVPVVLYAVPQLVGAEYSYVVLSGSMQPAMDPGDVTFVDAVEADAVQEGDIINFKRPADERTTTHRVVGVTEREGQPAFRTKGDSNPSPDQGIVTAEQFRGRVMHLGGIVFTIPLIGYLLQFTNSGPGFVLLFVIPMVLLVANEVYNVVSSASDPAEGDSGPPAGQQAAEPASGSTPAQSAGDPVPAADDAAETITFSPGELRLGVGVLAAFVAYSLWVATTDPGAFTIGVAGSTIVGFLMLGGLYLQARQADDAGPNRAGPAAAPHGSALTIRTAPLPDDEADGPRETVDSLPRLLDLAELHGVQLYRTSDGLRYHLSAGSTVYVYNTTDRATVDPPGEGTPSHSAGDDGTTGDTDQDKMGGNTDQDKMGGNTDQDKMGGNTDQDRMGGNTDQDRMGGNTDQEGTDDVPSVPTSGEEAASEPSDGEDQSLDRRRGPNVEAGDD